MGLNMERNIIEILKAKPELIRLILWLFDNHKLEEIYSPCTALALLQKYFSVKINEEINTEFYKLEKRYIKPGEVSKE